MIRLKAIVELKGLEPRGFAHNSAGERVLIGRDAAAHLRIPLSTVSRRHAEVSFVDGAYRIRDLGSSHGTLLNGERLRDGTSEVLCDGDIIEISVARITCCIEHADHLPSDYQPSVVTRHTADTILRDPKSSKTGKLECSVAETGASRPLGHGRGAAEALILSGALVLVYGVNMLMAVV